MENSLAITKESLQKKICEVLVNMSEKILPFLSYGSNDYKLTIVSASDGGSSKS